MITLRDILKLNFTITLIELDVRNTGGRLIKRVVIGEGYHVSAFQRADENKGKFEYINASINKHGRTDRRGFSEMAYDVDFKAIPKKYLDMEVDLIHSIRERYGSIDGGQIRATVIPVQMEMEAID